MNDSMVFLGSCRSEEQKKKAFLAELVERQKDLQRRALFKGPCRRNHYNKLR